MSLCRCLMKWAFEGTLIFLKRHPGLLRRFSSCFFFLSDFPTFYLLVDFTITNRVMLLLMH